MIKYIYINLARFQQELYNYICIYSRTPTVYTISQSLQRSTPQANTLEIEKAQSKYKIYC